MQATKAVRLRVFLSSPAVSETNSGAVLKGFMIGKRVAIVSTIASRKMSIALLRMRSPQWAENNWVPEDNSRLNMS
jgi:hypothetical protein